jgi:anti-anti-sigma regulatory factor
MPSSSWNERMNGQPRQIEVTVNGKAAVVRFVRTECLLISRNPRQDVGEDLRALIDRDHHSLIVIDFGNPDIQWLSRAFQAVLVLLHHRLSKVNGALRLCNVPEKIMEQFQVNKLVMVFNVYPTLELALQSDA